MDWDETEEVSTLFYIAKDMVQGRRAADELMLDWDDIAKVMKVLCEAQYHVTRKEITNFRERKVQQAMVAPEVDPAEVLQEIAGMNSAGPLHE